MKNLRHEITQLRRSLDESRYFIINLPLQHFLLQSSPCSLQLNLVVALCMTEIHIAQKTLHESEHKTSAFVPRISRFRAMLKKRSILF